eukprot:gnl/TRDRNA2_/TRDRNA2_157511_c1_seq3.p1 gnl/TRDRNA2_/TRDRNA2_157511_c1~~gnl/TRDRNA2_/TRDRNA2_157511_c1_seq3.p1  ORF type:complete len:108 (-),score=27.65 gnl/TRDRNA2_/TRDRNA2_157511_c1_seq3:23-346(-)
MACSFAKASKTDSQLFVALARASVRQLGSFMPEKLAGIVWAFATARLLDAYQFRLLAAAVEQHLGEFSDAQPLANIAWAFATMKQYDEKLFTALAVAGEQRIGELST